MLINICTTSFKNYEARQSEIKELVFKIYHRGASRLLVISTLVTFSKKIPSSLGLEIPSYYVPFLFL